VGDGEERQSLEQLVLTEKLSNVRFLGFQNQSQLPVFFSICDIFVLPSDNEPWGLIVNEVMNAGCPVVVTNEVGCHPDLVEEGINGYVYPVGDVPALSGILENLVAQPDLRRRMGEASLRIVAEHSYEQCVAGLHQFIKTLS
jgi:glycosyltransferase involved in cell wall biosynthesis